jgi:hypothetical protein
MNNHEQATQLIKKICEDYGITMKDLKKKKSGFPNRSVSRKGKDVSLASIRQALSYFIFMHFPLRIKEVAAMVGYSDHSPLSCQRKTIEYYIKTKDFYFYPYYEKVKEYAKQIGINTEVKRLILHETPFVRYESDIDFLSNLKYYENAETIR